MEFQLILEGIPLDFQWMFNGFWKVFQLIFSVRGGITNAFRMGFQYLLNEFSIDSGWIALI